MTDTVSLRKRGWMGPISGLLFFVALLAAAAVFGGFDFFGGVEVEPSWSTDRLLVAIRVKQGAIHNSSLIMLLGIGFLGFFIADLRVRAEKAGLGWPREGFVIGGALIGAAWLFYLGLQLAAHVAADNGHYESVQVMIDLLWLAFWLFLPGLLIFGVSAAIAGLRSELHPKWLGVLGILVAITALLPWDGLFVFVVWVAAASILQIVRNLKA